MIRTMGFGGGRRKQPMSAFAGFCLLLRAGVQRHGRICSQQKPTFAASAK